MSVRDLIIVGAGPTGLSAAIAAKQRGLDYLVLEQGALVNSILRFPPQMVFFTTPELLEIGGLPFISPYEKPTRVEALRYYRKVADAYDLQIAFGERVGSIVPESDEARQANIRSLFAIETESSRPLTLGGEASTAQVSKALRLESASQEPSDTAIIRRVRHARHVVLAIGYYDHPNRLNIPGEDLPHVRHYYSEPYAYYRQRVVIIGGGNSAAESALELFRAGAAVTLIHRRPTLKSTIKYWVLPDIENRIKEGSIAARFNTCATEIQPTSVVIRGPDGLEELPADAVFVLTGYRADADLMRRAGVTLDDRDTPTYDPETFETNVAGLFVAGGALAGADTGNIFIENGRFHGERIVEAIVGRSMGGL
jgi:thioredoxin reductase (NADPH)